MFKNQINRVRSTIFGIAMLSFLVFSCTSELDFDQTNDLILEPVIVSNVASFEVKANQFVTAGVEQTTFSDIPNFDLFQDSFFKSNLAKVEVFLEFNNTISRAFSIDLVLLDDANNSLYTINIPVAAHTGTQKLVTKTEVFETNLSVLQNTAKMAFTINLLPGTPLAETSPGNIKLRSNMTAYFKIE